jgi:hypothetical protein
LLSSPNCSRDSKQSEIRTNILDLTSRFDKTLRDPEKRRIYFGAGPMPITQPAYCGWHVQRRSAKRGGQHLLIMILQLARSAIDPRFICFAISPFRFSLIGTTGSLFGREDGYHQELRVPHLFLFEALSGYRINSQAWRQARRKGIESFC